MPSWFSEDAYYGYSDHTVGIAAPLTSFFRNAKILEKHYSNNTMAQSKFEGGHLGSFDQQSLKQFKDLTKEIKIIRS
jgi:sialic acid synthase SpsE